MTIKHVLLVANKGGGTGDIATSRFNTFTMYYRLDWYLGRNLAFQSFLRRNAVKQNHIPDNRNTVITTSLP